MPLLSVPTWLLWKWDALIFWFESSFLIWKTPFDIIPLSPICPSGQSTFHPTIVNQHRSVANTKVRWWRILAQITFNSYFDTIWISRLLKVGCWSPNLIGSIVKLYAQPKGAHPCASWVGENFEMTNFDPFPHEKSIA